MPRHFPDWIKAYLEYTSYSEAPESFHFWTAVSTIAGALRKKVYIDQEFFIWTPNFYIIFVAPAGVANKSTSAGIGMGLLRSVPGVKFGSNALTWQAMCQELAQAAEGIDMGAGNPIGGFNLDSQYTTMSCLTYEASELGSLLDMHDTQMLNILTDLWDGKKDHIWKKKSKTQGEDEIPNPWINILAATTPKWIAENFPKVAIGGGFTSRCLFIYEDKKSRYIPYPKGKIPESVKAMKHLLIEDLISIAEMKGEYIMTSEAIAFGEDWYIKHHQSYPKHLSSGDFGGYLARKQTHVHKLAIVLAASKSSELILGVDELKAAVAFVDSVENFMGHVYGEVNASPHQDGASRVLEIISKHPEGISKAMLYRMVIRLMSNKDFEAAINAGLTADLIVLHNDGLNLVVKPKVH